eukprot:TRINITY_DN1879_c0_g1_i1.p1 TRINITY_DN1879_c0_g1~~TRINITY_DN1879_c0_g1_i1.p1  ORF type:complete len:216 (+),score=40.18 TRINITY_DN1879_c0_g1_i1:48-650(+)
MAGEMYFSGDPQLVAERKQCRRLMRRFNQDAEDANDDDREKLMKDLIPNCGSYNFIEPPFACDYGFNIHMGDRVFINFNCVILDVNKVEIGHDTMFAPNVQIYTATHPVDCVLRDTGRELGFPIKIGNHCWLGGGCIILPGVTLGDNVTVGAGAVVTKSFPSNVVIAGNPAKVIKQLEVPDPEAVKATETHIKPIALHRQ